MSMEGSDIRVEDEDIWDGFQWILSPYESYLINMEAVIRSAFDDSFYFSHPDDLNPPSTPVTVYGGAGNDITRFVRLVTTDGVFGDGHDTVYNFDPTNDLSLIETEDATFDPFTVFTDTAEGVIVDHAPDSSVLLVDITAAELTTENLVAMSPYAGTIG